MPTELSHVKQSHEPTRLYFSQRRTELLKNIDMLVEQEAGYAHAPCWLS
jgi:hypothetical protein